MPRRKYGRLRKTVELPPKGNCSRCRSGKFCPIEGHMGQEVTSNRPLEPLTEEEKKQVINAAKKETLEESVDYMVWHLMARWRESGEPEPTPINNVEELAMRHRRLTSSSSTTHQQKSPTNGEKDQSESSDDEFFDPAPPNHSDDESDERNMATFGVHT